MKFKIASVLLAGMLIAPAVLADCQFTMGGHRMGNVFSGPTTCTGKVTDSITVNGPLTIDNATMSNVAVNGPVNAKNSTIANLSANGIVTLDQIKVNDLSFNGTLRAAKSTISSIDAQGSLRLLDSHAGNITIKKPAKVGQYTIHLCGTTVVQGNINFAGDNGLIYVDKIAKVIGEVAGAKMQVVSSCDAS